MTRPAPVYGLVAEFSRPADVIAAARAAREHGYTRVEAYSPYPLEELAEALHIHRTGMPLVMLIGGIVGCIGGFLMQYYAAVIGYPLNIGGRPLNSWPAFIPVTFELTVLLSALAGTFGLLGLCGLPTPYHPLFHVPQFARVTRDHFFLCIERRDPRFDLDRTREFLRGTGALAVEEVPA
jgi:hypothetical protein